MRADRSKVGNFIEEALRYESPVKGDFRLATGPVTLGGVEVPAGATLMVVNAAANRDPRRFTDPTPSTRSARMPASTSHSGEESIPAPVRRWPAPKPAPPWSGCSTAPPTSASAKLTTGRSAPAATAMCPTYILRGLTELHLEFDLP